MKDVDFIDARWVEHTFFLTRKITQPERFLDTPVISPSPAAASGTVLPTDDRLALWYVAPYRRPDGTDEPLYRHCVHYATSRDGVTFDKPDLGLRSFEFTDERNIILTQNDTGQNGGLICGSKGCSGFCVLDAELQDLPHVRGRYTAMYNTSIPNRGGGLCLAWSNDGLRWNAYPENPVRPGSSDTYNNVFYDARTQRYAAFIRPNIHAGPARVNRLVARVESENLIHWSDGRVVLDTDDRDAPAQGRIELKKGTLGYPRGRDIQFYGLTAKPYQDLILGIAPVYDVTSGFMWTELVHSYDGIEWRREARREPLIGLGEPGTWDSGMIAYPAAGCPIAVGDWWYIYYSGTNWTHHFQITGLKDQGRMRHIGAVRLKRGRLIGYTTEPVPHASEPATRREVPPDWLDKGELMTRPFVTDCADLFLNADATDGRITVEVCGLDGKPLPGYAAEDAVPIARDALMLPVQFRGSEGIRALHGERMRLRLHLEKATVYGLAFR